MFSLGEGIGISSSLVGWCFGYEMVVYFLWFLLHLQIKNGNLSIELKKKAMGE